MTTTFANLSGRLATDVSISIPYYGRWAADVTLSTDDPIVGQAVLNLGAIVGICHVERSESFVGKRSVRVVGGFGGWAKEVPSASYANPSGVRVGTVLRDVASLVGERVETDRIAETAVLGPHYVREEAAASRVLRECAGGLWYVRLDGVTSLAARPSDMVASAFQVGKRRGATGQIRVTTETPDDWIPGRQFQSVTMLSPVTILHSYIRCEPSGRLTVDVLT